MAECEHLARTSAYFDGALPVAEEAAATEHLATCAACQSLLSDAMGIDAALSQKSNVVPFAPRKRSPVIVGAAVLGIAAAAAVVAWLAWPRTGPEAVAWSLPASRAVAVRFSGPHFGGYRPYDPPRGAATHEAISLAALADLERRGDAHDLVAALASAGDTARAEDLAAHLPDDADGEIDRAAVAFLYGDAERALGHAYHAVDRAPDQPAAWWNLAIAAEALGLPHVARNAWERVIAANELGWIDEARGKPAAIDQRDLAREADFTAFESACHAMVDGGPVLAAADVARSPAYARSSFLDAVRLADSPARIDALRPLALALDGGTAGVATAFLAHASPAIAARFGATYKKLAARTLKAADVDALIAALRMAGPAADAMRAGAINLSGRAGEHVDELHAIVAPWHDPWFDLLVERETILAKYPTNDPRQRAPLEAALKACPPGDAWALRCGLFALDLGDLDIAELRYDDAKDRLTDATARFRAAVAPAFEQRAKMSFAEVARGTVRPLARGLYEEIALSPLADCNIQRFATTGAAALAWRAGDYAASRAALPPVEPDAACSHAVDQVPVEVAVDLAYLTKRGDDRETAQRWIDAASAADPGFLSGALPVIGAARLSPSAETMAALEAWLSSHAAAAAADPMLAAVHTWGMTTLLSDAATRSGYARVLALAGAPTDTPCALATLADDDVVTFAYRTPAGTAGYRHKFGAPIADADDLAPPAEMSRALASGCPALAVVARPPMHGRADLVPPQVRWWFVGDRPPIDGPSGLPRSVQVSGVREPGSALPPLTGTPGPFDVKLSGDAATPDAVLGALSTATYAELHVHGLTSATDPDATYLALSPGADGKFALRADAVRAAHFSNGPIIVLASCRAGHVAPWLRMRASLPDAFLAAGASAVVAADIDIPDAAAAVIFTELHRRIDAGEPVWSAVAALRAMSAQDSWIRHLMVFR
ncbi:MAG TPA: CHAT domain-containing protein [Kofleriaceae bacterium]|jgi:hypothetical protein